MRWSSPRERWFSARCCPKTCPRFIKSFAVTKPIQTAIVSICGLGLYELHLNGSKADRSVLSGANSRYEKKVFFDTLDVTSKLKVGENVIGVWLAPGYSDDFNVYGWKWEAPKRARIQLDLTFRDGSKQTVVSDQSWHCAESPIDYTSLYHGERQDARRENSRWAAAPLKNSPGLAVAELPDLQVPLLPSQAARLEVAADLRPLAVTEPKPGVFVFDLGQAFAGWVKLRAKGDRGTTIRLRHSELIGADGLIDPWTNRLARAEDTFILNGTEREEFEPHFTYHGFRYVEVTGYPGRPTLDDVVGRVLRSSMPAAAKFVSSDPLLNQIERNCVWSMGSNLLSIPTDCCMRDERTPCLMDSLAYEDSALVHFQANGFYHQWLRNIDGERGNPDWTGDAVMLPWRLYREYGDLRALEAHYGNMRGVVEAMADKAPDHLFKTGYGDWCAPSDGKSFLHCFSSVTEVNTSLYAEEARTLSRAAERLGRTDDARRYQSLSAEIARALNTHVFDPARSAYGSGAQATALLPLALQLVPRDREAAVVARLVETITTADRGHLNTGIFGTRYLLDVLCDHGHEDLALAMLHAPGYPGFAYQIEMGATTLWEQWRYRA
jgi:alpha-L-rhamnosidase